MPERIAVIGMGYVGLVNAAHFAAEGHEVTGVEINPQRLAGLQNGEIGFYEPGLAEVVAAAQRAGRLTFTGDAAEGVRESRMVFLAVGTPKAANGRVDLSQIERAARDVGGAIAPGTIVVIRSTVPTQTAARVQSIIRDLRGEQFPVAVVSHPEFLQQGSALWGMAHPDRIVVGGDDPMALDRIAGLYHGTQCAVIKTNHQTASMIKYLSNAFLAAKVSFANEMAKLCDALGVDFLEAMRGVGLDRRIGTDFFAPGPGFGGSCFPKDVAGLVAMGDETGVDLVLMKSVLRTNHRQPRYVYRKIRSQVGPVRGKVITLLGLSFKANTDDVRESPALDVARILLSEGAVVRAYDPVAEDRSRTVLPAVRYSSDVYGAATGADAVVVCTEWEEFRTLDLDRLSKVMAVPVLIDARNIINPVDALHHAFRYSGIGRGSDWHGTLDDGPAEDRQSGRGAEIERLEESAARGRTGDGP